MSVIPPSDQFLGTFDGLSLVLRQLHDHDNPEPLAMLIHKNFESALVNKFWRYVTLKTPILWRTIHVAAGLPDSHPVGARQKFLPTYISRSGALPIILCITGQPMQSERIPACVAATSERWVNLRIGLERDKIGEYLGEVQNKLPMLRSLTLAPRHRFVCTGGTLRSADYDDIFKTAVFKVAPSLQILNIMYYPVDDLIDPEKFPVTQIRCLKYILKPQIFDACYLREILQTFPALQCLSLDGVVWSPSFEPVNGSILHKELRMLDLYFNEPEEPEESDANPECIFTFMNLPALDTLRISLVEAFDSTLNWPQREFCGMLNRSRFSLRALVLSDMVIESPCILEILRCLPELTHLEITALNSFYRGWSRFPIGSLCDVRIMINPWLFNELTVTQQVDVILPKLSSLTLGTRWTPELIQACITMLKSRLHRAGVPVCYPGQCLKTFLFDHYPERYSNYSDPYEENDLFPDDFPLKRYGSRLRKRQDLIDFDGFSDSSSDVSDASMETCWNIAEAPEKISDTSVTTPMFPDHDSQSEIPQDTVRERAVDGVDPAFVAQWHGGNIFDSDILSVKDFEDFIAEKDENVDMGEIWGSPLASSATS